MQLNLCQQVMDGLSFQEIIHFQDSSRKSQIKNRQWPHLWQMELTCSRQVSQCIILSLRQRGKGILLIGKETYVFLNPHSYPTPRVGNTRLTIFSTTVEYHRVRCFIKIILSWPVLFLCSSSFLYKCRSQFFSSFSEVKVGRNWAEMSCIQNKSIPCLLWGCSTAFQLSEISFSNLPLKWIFTCMGTVMSPMDHFLLHCKLSKHLSQKASYLLIRSH